MTRSRRIRFPRAAHPSRTSREKPMFRMRAQTGALAAVTVSLLLILAGPAVAKDVKYDPQTIYFTYCFSHPPAARVSSGDKVITKTRDASNEAFRTTHKKLSEGNLDLSRVNPQTGPFFVEGAEPGDTLKVTINKIALNRDWGWAGAI